MVSGLIDYLFLAYTTSFSPSTDAALSRRAKVLMMVQSVVALVIVTGVVHRGGSHCPK